MKSQLLIKDSTAAQLDENESSSQASSENSLIATAAPPKFRKRTESGPTSVRLGSGRVVATSSPARHPRRLPYRRPSRSQHSPERGRLLARRARWLSAGVLGILSLAGAAAAGIRHWRSRPIYLQTRPSPYTAQAVLQQNFEAKRVRAEAELAAGKLIPPTQKQGPIAYETRPGDTLQRLSQMFQVESAAIALSNGIDAKAKLTASQKVYIPRPKSIVRVVREGETLESIAAEYRLDPAAIARATPLEDFSRVEVGQTLTIPGTAAGLLHAHSLSQAGYETFPPDKPGIEGVGSPIVSAPSSSGLIWPVSGDYSSGFGWRWGRPHRGIDIAGPVGSPIGAVKDGTVTFADWDGGFGNKVEIQHADGMVTRYAHGDRIFVAKGQQVQQGQVIMTRGSTGLSTGPHLHFEVWIDGEPIDPEPFLRD
ncbi:MAG: M23 family metallopeptidase [Cyanobacteria bacterium J06642_2]